MDFPQPLVRGRLVQRYKRFLADVVLDDGGRAEINTVESDDTLDASRLRRGRRG